MTRHRPSRPQPPAAGGSALSGVIVNPWPRALFRLGLQPLGPVTVEQLAVVAAFLHETDKGSSVTRAQDWLICAQWVLAHVARAGGIEVPDRD